MRHMLIEGFVFLFSDFALRARPQRTGLINGFFLTRRLHGLGFFVPAFLDHTDRQSNVIGVLAQDFADLPAIDQIFLFGTQVQNHFRTTTRVIDIGHGVLALTCRHPLHAFVSGCASLAATYRDLVSNDKRRVETHTKLTDQISVLLVIARQGRKELLGSRFGNRPKMGNRLVLGHTNAVVGNRDGLGVCIQQNPQAQLRIIFK